MAIILDGKAVAAKVKCEVKEKVDLLKKEGKQAVFSLHRHSKLPYRLLSSLSSEADKELCLP